VVVTALLLVSLVTMWHWPRGDARFVGKWDVGTGSAFELRANGWGSFHISPSPEMPGSQRMRWYVVGSDLYLDTWSPQWDHQLQHLIATLKGQGRQPTRFAIVSAEHDEIRVRQPDGYVQEWTRLPE
jgi:hypothetical protein